MTTFNGEAADPLGMQCKGCPLRGVPLGAWVLQSQQQCLWHHIPQQAPFQDSLNPYVGASEPS